jgi:hypothetical protein
MDRTEWSHFADSRSVATASEASHGPSSCSRSEDVSIEKIAALVENSGAPSELRERFARTLDALRSSLEKTGAVAVDFDGKRLTRRRILYGQYAHEKHFSNGEMPG